jgi:hypothetical protein
MRDWVRLRAAHGLSLGLALLVVSGGGACGASPPGDVRVITVEGAGKDIEAAKRDAYREAVRQVVGSYVDSETLVRNDSLIEDRIITLSNGFVEKSETISKRMEEGLTRVRLRAHVRVTPILRALQSQNVTTEMVDSESLQAQLTTKGDQAEGLEQVLAAVLPTLHEKSLRVTVPGKPAVRAVRGDEATIAFRVAIGPNLEGYLAAAAKLDAALSAAERPSGEIVSSGNKLANGKDYREHVRWQKRHQAEYFLQQFFVADAEKRRIAQLLDDDGACPIIDYEPLYCVADATASPPEWGSSVLLLQNGSWKQAIRENGSVIICLLVHANSSFVQTRWKWFRLTPDEAAIFYEQIPGNVTCTSVLNGSDGSECGRDQVPLTGVGSLQLNRSSVAIAPFFMVGDTLSHYIPTLSLEREVTLTKDEAARVGQIRATVTAGPRMRRPDY